MKLGGASEITIPLTFIAKETANITFTINSGVPTTNVEYVEYSLDNGANWTKVNNVDNTEVIVTIPTLQAKQSVQMRGKATAYGVNYVVLSKFAITNKVEAYGNIMSLLNPDFKNLDEVSYRCFISMFQDCIGLERPPLLPATKLNGECYSGMFKSTYIRTAPELPAIELASGCYGTMFNDCPYLTETPILKAKTLKYECYRDMFQTCPNLNKVTMLATDISASDCLTNWMNQVAPTGTFIKNPAMTTLPTGNNGIPSGWTVQDYAG